MLGAALILSEETEKLFFDSLNKIDEVEWNGIYSSNNKTSRQLNQVLIFSSPEIIPMICDALVILDPKFCTFEYLSLAIRNGCHLFLTDKFELNTEERKELILLAKEGNTYIQIQNNFLSQPEIQKPFRGLSTPKGFPLSGPAYIEIKQSVQSESDNLKEVLLNNLSLILMVEGTQVHKINVFCGTAPSRQPDILNIHINFANGSTASLTILYKANQRIHKLYIYRNGEKSTFDFIMNRSEINSEKGTALSPSFTLPDQIQGFVNTVIEKSDPLYSLNDEIEIFQLLEKIKEKFELHSVTF